jgi:hypothetical protein
MELETTLANSLDQMLALQIQMNPATAESAEAMKEILADYLSFECFKALLSSISTSTPIRPQSSASWWLFTKPRWARKSISRDA